MQTFLPYADFARSAQVLDSPRLGKQRVETLQILRALELPEYGWANHPAVVMWRGRTAALVRYGLDVVAEWRLRGYGDTTAEPIAEFAPDGAAMSQEQLGELGLLPGWLGDPRLHSSHQSRLVAKDADHYGAAFAGVAMELDYFWPEPDDVVPPSPAVGSDLWVVRPESDAALGRFLADGVVGLGAESGVRADAEGRDLTGLRELVEGRSNRVTKPLRALAALLELPVGTPVAVLAAGGATLLAGHITGDYRHDVDKDSVGLRHVRPVRWDRVLRRSDVVPPSALQDVRPLFRVTESGTMEA